ncbi:MAG: cell wall hydrolase [Geosporobacter ferrireducens]|nr:cell wall hydrolase [Geosporobacter ferrireducens]
MVFLILSVPITSAFANEGQSTTYVTLKFGSRGSAVTRLQQALINQGYLKGSADGIYGLKTEKAVIDFQIAKKLRIDGIAGRETQTALFAQPVSRGTALRDDDLYWLARIIHAESEAEPYRGKVAVGSVVVNRVHSKSFPNTVKGVIFEYFEGIPQFSPVAEGTIYNTPNQDSINAARDALNGVKPVGNAEYFFNPDKAAGRWIVQNKTYVTRIGDHVFYR